MSAHITKTIEIYTAQRVTLTSKKHIKDVLTALDIEVNKEGGGINMMLMLANAKSKEEIDTGMKKMSDGGKRDFVLFAAGSHSRWLSAYHSGRKFLETHIYTIGNPLIAQAMLQHDLTAGLHVPPKLLVVEMEGGKGTNIVFDLPSSVIIVGKNVSPELKKTAAVLDDKFERMVRKVLA
ncbi:hypothetical protein EUX98_g1363 [Antrodiella citrinella]|uniref:DUF302 domain-containing protein n=1 Tax=Antrodiella citrinella TaxID=2447956 RepID=A0A4S4N426_9APHY|nr:hypothetical protein EUX98_g1363 [Antrodiella citrinella]